MPESPGLCSLGKQPSLSPRCLLGEPGPSAHLRGEQGGDVVKAVAVALGAHQLEDTELQTHLVSRSPQDG